MSAEGLVSASSAPTVDELRAELARYSFRHTAETDLQRGIELALERARIACAREVVLPEGRLDFLCGEIAIEVKADGSLAELTRQVHRYLQSPKLAGLLVVTTRSRHLDLPLEISGKPVRVLWAGSALFGSAS